MLNKDILFFELITKPPINILVCIQPHHQTPPPPPPPPAPHSYLFQLNRTLCLLYHLTITFEKLNIDGKFEKAERLYNNNLFFRTLISNSMMSLEKSFFKLTDYMKNDEEFGGFWNLIYNEYLRTKKYILKLTKLNNLMEDQPGSNRRHSAWKADALPTELLPRFNFQCGESRIRTCEVKKQQIYSLSSLAA